MIGLPYAEELHVKPFRYNTRVWRTDGRTDGQNSYISIARQPCVAFIGENKTYKKRWPPLSVIFVKWLIYASCLATASRRGIVYANLCLLWHHHVCCDVTMFVVTSRCLLSLERYPKLIKLSSWNFKNRRSVAVE